MHNETRRAVEEYRRTTAGPIENNLIDELVHGELDRGEFLQRGAMFGLSAGMLGSLLGYAGAAHAAGTRAAEVAVKRGGTIRVGMNPTAGANEPYKLGTSGSLGFVGIPGEFLTFVDNQLRVQPWLAISWKPNADASVWRFQLRRGVKFHNGKIMTADDVVASFKQYTGNPQSGALSTLKGTLSPGGVVKRGSYTVDFRLDKPTGAFPYLVSQNTYQTIIQPRQFALKPDTWEAGGMIGTGAFKLVKQVPEVSARLVRFPQYWGGPAPLDAVELTFYTSPDAQVLALRGGQADLLQAVTPQSASPFRNSSKYKIFSAPTSAHFQFCLRVDVEPFKDARTRRAVALVLNRPELVRKLVLTEGSLGNDSPFWSQYPSTDPSIHQRAQNLALAKSLLQASGHQNLTFTITTYDGHDLPEYAAIIQAAGREAGMNISIDVEDANTYFGGSSTDYYGTTPWLNKPATLTDWGARGVPDTFLTGSYISDGVWNAAHYKNPQFDSLAKSFLGAADIQSQRKYTKRMAGLLLRDTPVVTGFFVDTVTAGLSKVQNYRVDGVQHVNLAKTWLS